MPSATAALSSAATSARPERSLPFRRTVTGAPPRRLRHQVRRRSLVASTSSPSRTKLTGVVIALPLLRPVTVISIALPSSLCSGDRSSSFTKALNSPIRPSRSSGAARACGRAEGLPADLVQPNQLVEALDLGLAAGPAPEPPADGQL